MFAIKTLVEIFDDNQFNNIIAMVRFKPEKVVFVGYSELMKTRRKNAIERFLAERNMQVDIEYCYVDRYNLDDIVGKLELIVKTNPDCYFDLTGGKELALVAIGTVAAKHNLPMFQLNVRNNNFFKVKNCEMLPSPQVETCTIKQSIILNGGVIPENVFEKFHWDFSEEFCKDIRTMWEICKGSCGKWNRQSTVLMGLSNSWKTDVLEVRINNKRRELHEEIIKPLFEKGLLTDYEDNGNETVFRYKNNQIRQCLIKAGNILELYALMTVREIMQQDPGYFDDADIGVHIDWDGDEFSGRSVTNEVDIMLMRDMLPVFISCKNGEVHKEALYEISAVAEKFTGMYAKKVLLTTFISHDIESKKFLLQRASEMNISVIDGVDKMTHEEFIKELKEKTR